MIKSLLVAPLAILGGESAASTTENVFPKICATCRHYEPPFDARSGMLIDGPVGSYCRHPENMQGFYAFEHTVRTLGLHRNPGDSCRRYEKIVFET